MPIDLQTVDENMDNIALRYAHENDLDRFLFAEVGEDRNGNIVTVLSTLARIGLDPRKEAADLAVMSRKKAQIRLASLLTDFNDVPSLDSDAAATRLIKLLPKHGYRSSEPSAPSIYKMPVISKGTILAIFIIVLVFVELFGFGIFN